MEYFLLILLLCLLFVILKSKNVKKNSYETFFINYFIDNTKKVDIYKESKNKYSYILTTKLYYGRIIENKLYVQRIGNKLNQSICSIKLTQKELSDLIR